MVEVLNAQLGAWEQAAVVSLGHDGDCELQLPLTGERMRVSLLDQPWKMRRQEDKETDRAAHVMVSQSDQLTQFTASSPDLPAEMRAMDWFGRFFFD